MQVTITIDGAALRRATFCALALGGVLALGSAHASSVTIPNAFTAGTQISAAQMNANFAALETAVDDNDARLAALETLLAGATRTGATIQLSGVNLQLVNGSGDTHTANGNGNLILGYDAGGTGGGSHNLVIGDGHTYAGTGGVVVGENHATSGESAVALGGRDNTAAQLSAIVGGSNNMTETGGVGATPEGSVIVGGLNNSIQGVNSAILGGDGGRVEADPAEPGIADGDTVTLVGVIDGAITGGTGDNTVFENHATAVGSNCTGIAIGQCGGFVELGSDVRTFLALGLTQSAPASNGVFIGFGQNNTSVSGANVGLGNGPPGGPGQPAQSANVTIHGANIGVGDTGSSVNIGQDGDTIVVGDNAMQVRVAFGSTSSNFGGNGANVNIGVNADTIVVGSDVGGTANLEIGVNAASVIVGGGPASSVSLGDNSASLSVGINTTTVNIAPDNTP